MLKKLNSEFSDCFNGFNMFLQLKENSINLKSNHVQPVLSKTSIPTQTGSQISISIQNESESSTKNDSKIQIKATKLSCFNTTISSYNRYLLMFYNVSCLIIAATTILHSYMFYYRRDHYLLPVFYRTSDFFYGFVIFLRLRTSFTKNGLEVFDQRKIWKRFAIFICFIYFFLIYFMVATKH